MDKGKVYSDRQKKNLKSLNARGPDRMAFLGLSGEFHSPMTLTPSCFDNKVSCFCVENVGTLS